MSGATISGPVAIDIKIDPASIDVMNRSLASVFDVLVAPRPGLKALADRLGIELRSVTEGSVADLLHDRVDLRAVEPVTGAAGGALEFVVYPPDGYVELVAAIATHGDVTLNIDLHGWPVLSLGCDTPSVTEAAEASSLGRGGN